MKRTKNGTAEKGSVLMELVLVLPLLVLIVMLVLEGSKLVRTHQVLNNAAREGARLSTGSLALQAGDPLRRLHVEPAGDAQPHPRVPAAAARPAVGPLFIVLVNDRHRIRLSAQHGHHRFDEVGGDNDTESLLTLTGLKGLLKYVNGPRAHGQLRLKFL